MSKVKKIKITSCKNNKWWYANQVGNEFELIPGEANYNSELCFVVKAEGLTHLGKGYVNKDDAKIIEENKNKDPKKEG